MILVNISYKTEIDSQTWEISIWLPKGKEGEIN